MDQTGDLMQEKIQHLPRVIVARQCPISNLHVVSGGNGGNTG